MNEGERKEEEEELEEEELHPPARWLQRTGYSITIKLTCEKLRELEPQEAIKFLEEELRITERDSVRWLSGSSIMMQNMFALSEGKLSGCGRR